MEPSNSKKFESFLLIAFLILLVGVGIYYGITRGVLNPGANSPQANPSELADLNSPSPDGEYVASVTAVDAGMNGSSIQFSRQGAKEVTVVAKGDEASWVTNPVWSPDGKKIAYLRIKNYQPGTYEINSKFELWVYTLASGDDKLITDAATLNPSISFDGIADLKWLSDNEIQYPDNAAFPIQYYTVNIDTLHALRSWSDSTALTLCTNCWREDCSFK